jgi:L-alanine-DL-glutamate epimerase-like enolase superfamily enzyme
MRASSFRAGSAPIPFRTSFGHASATRDVAANVLVRVDDIDGRFGLGEGCPRDYVTGETVAGARQFLEEHAGAFCALESLEALRTWAATYEAEIDTNPSAFCAAELALLDMFARQRDESVEALLGLPDAGARIAASAIYGTGGTLKFHLRCLAFSVFGIHDAKLKVSGDTARDRSRATMLARRGKLRLDANNLWPDAASATGGLAGMAPPAWAVEEPVAPRDWQGMQEVASKTGARIIADESFTRLSDLDSMPEDFVVNVRVSKLGGLLRSLAAIARAREQGRGIIVGAQVGETSILARAGLCVAAAAGPHLLGYEGAYGVRLLRWDLVDPSIGFGRGGVVSCNTGPAGLGLKPLAAFDRALT